MTARVSFVEWAQRAARALGWIALFAAAGFGSAWVLVRVVVVPLARDSAWYAAGAAAATCVGFGAATWLVGLRLGRQTWRHWGWPAAAAGWRPWLRGVALGILMAGLAVGLSVWASRAAVGATGDWAGYAAAALPLAVFFAGAALAEELLFRGYPLRRLADAIGPWAAVVVVAVGFAAAHLGNPGVSVIGVVNIAIAGLWLSVAFFSPGGMPLAWGLHFGWNGGLGVLFDAPVSGHRFALPVVEYAPGRHMWMDGGAFGPEGGLAATLVLIAGTLAIVGSRVRRPAAWLA